MKKIFKEFLRYLILTAGAVIYAAAIALFLNPLSLAPGGVSGIAIILSHLINIPTGSIIIAINVPLMVIAFLKFGKRFFFSTAYVTFFSSILVDLIANVTEKYSFTVTNDLFLAGIAGGALVGLGIGTIFHAGGTTGGADIIIKLLRKKHKHINTGTLFFMFDMTVILTSAIAFKNIEIALYALVSIFVISKVLDFVLYGLEQNKLVYIISERSESVAKRLMTELDLGCTYINGEGAYTGKQKKILLCAVKNQTFPKLKRTVLEEDREAFMIVSSTSAVFGEGYKPIDKEDL